jgi:acyl-CoA thioester hydrolase
MFPSSASIRATLSPKLKEMVRIYPSVYKQPVQWGELDRFGHVNNIWYLRYTETARFAHLYQVLKPILSPTQFSDFEEGKGKGIIIKSCLLEYRAPLTFPDEVILATRIGKMEESEYSQETVIVSTKMERVVCRSTSIVVGYDYDLGKKTALGKEYHDAFLASKL